MPNAKDMVPGKYIRALFVGKSGTRKTSVAASFPAPRYSFDFDGRIASLRGVDIDYDTYTRASGWGKAEEKLNTFLAQARNGLLPYRTIHFASITTILDFFLWEAKSHYETETSQTSGLRVKRPNTNKTLLMSDMPHYKFVHAALDQLLYNYILPLSMVANVIVEGHETTKYDKQGDIVGDQLLATGAITERLPTIFDETWHFKFKKSYIKNEPDEYRIWFRNTDLAKTVYRSLPESVVVTNKERSFYDDIFLPALEKENQIEQG